MKCWSSCFYHILQLKNVYIHFWCSQFSVIETVQRSRSSQKLGIWVRKKILNRYPFLSRHNFQIFVVHIKFLSFGNICNLFWTDLNSFFYILQVQQQTRQPQKRSSMVMPPNFLMLWLQELCADKRRPFWYLTLAKFLDGGTTEMDSWAPEMLSIN